MTLNIGIIFVADREMRNGEQMAPPTIHKLNIPWPGHATLFKLASISKLTIPLIRWW